MVVRKRWYDLLNFTFILSKFFTCLSTSYINLVLICTHVNFYSVWQLPQTNPGFNNTPFKFTKYSNAYMLVYIRESDKDKIICNVDEKDIAEHLRVVLFIQIIFSWLPIKCGNMWKQADFSHHHTDKVKERAGREGRQEKIQSTGPSLCYH